MAYRVEDGDARAIALLAGLNHPVVVFRERHHLDDDNDRFAEVCVRPRDIIDQLAPDLTMHLWRTTHEPHGQMHYRDVNAILNHTILRISTRLTRLGIANLPVPASQIIEWAPPQMGHLSHRILACMAGLGWIGKSGLVVTPEFMSAVRFASLLIKP